MKRTTGIDIILPVYNALEDLKLCMESILRHTDLSVDRVVLIDDKSPDEAVYPYLKSLEQPGVVVLRNAQNQGFSGTVNHGLEYSDRDVILLNTDTIVTANWVDQIVACAYSDPAIGTVTPLSNNATLCSIPNFCEENTVPYGLSIDEYAAVIERCSMKKYPRITVAVGFCMFIKREVVEKTGLFDKETFQRGYGEENDFCWRAEQLGYYHALCDDTYIYHSGTASFLSEEKKKLIAEHEQILQTRYPRQNQGNAEYVRDNPHQFLRSNVDIYAKLKNGKKNILYLLHTDFRADSSNNIGGTQFHVKDLAMNLRENHNVFVLARDNEAMRLTAYLAGEQISFKFRIGKRNIFMPFHDAQIAKVIREVLTAFSIDLVHVHHVSDLSFDIFSETKALGIPLVTTLHDYYYICPTVKLLENGKTYCGGCGKDCVSCLSDQAGYTRQIRYLPVWQAECRRVLDLCDALITPSEAAKQVYAANYPELEDKLKVIPHGMDTFEQEEPEIRSGASDGLFYKMEETFADGYTISGWVYQQGEKNEENEVFLVLWDGEGRIGRYRALTVSRPDVAQEKGTNDYLHCGFSVRIPDGYFASGNLNAQVQICNNGREYHGEETVLKGYAKREKSRKRIAFLGGISEAKGSQIAYQMMSQGGSKYDWYIVGGMGDPNLITLEKSNVFKTGWYKREDVGTILKQNLIDLVCILPIWPETFCYTISEAELAGIPILATDMGALGERLRRDETGWLIDVNMPIREILQKIDGIFADQQQYDRVAQNAAAFRHRSIVEMCEAYAEFYTEFEAPANRQEDFDREYIFHGYLLCQTGADGYGDASDVELIQRVNMLEMTLANINMSLEYRMVKFFNRESFPFKKAFQWLVGFAYRVYQKLKRR